MRGLGGVVPFTVAGNLEATSRIADAMPYPSHRAFALECA